MSELTDGPCPEAEPGQGHDWRIAAPGLPYRWYRRWCARCGKSRR